MSSHAKEAPRLLLKAKVYVMTLWQISDMTQQSDKSSTLPEAAPETKEQVDK